MRKNVKGFLAAALSLSMAASPCQMAFAATTSNEVTQREIEHAALAREAATQGMVLLENENNTLPLKTNKIALFGGGAVRTIKGGFGSGDPYNGGLSGGGAWDVELNERYNIHIYNSFKKAGYDIVNAKMLDAYAEAYDAQHKIEGNSTMSCFNFPDLKITEDQLSDAAAKADTAIFVVSRNAGEGTDRTLNGTKKNYNGESYDIGDYYLTDLERENLERVAASFDKTVVVLNVGGIVDTKFYNEIEGVDAMLLMGQAGQEGGNALMDVLSGAVTPSGKLADTWAVNYSDYPAAETFANADGNIKKEVYNEGIYVGYRYFDTFNIAPAYEFGYGMSYTDFSIETQSVEADADKVTVTAKVTNTGKLYSGKEVVQVYFSAPDSEEAEKEYQELAAFGKTDELAPGESQTLTLSYDTADMAYYNEAEAAYILDPGAYYIRVGNSSRNTSVEAVVEIDSKKTTEELSNQLTVPEGEELIEWNKPDVSYSYASEDAEKAEAPVIKVSAEDIAAENHASVYDGEEVTTYTTDASYEATQAYEKVAVVEKKESTLKDVIEGKVTMGEFIAQMSAEELAALNCGSGWGVANENSPIVGSNSSTVKGAAGETTVYDQYGIPGIVLADGPGGVRVAQEFEATIEATGEKQTFYQYCTAWPVSYVQAQSWDVDLVKRIGVAFGKEVDEMNITLLLGPSQNIHRDPLCGRNFEYYSEDPVMSGVMAAACTLGVQETPGVGACLKHFAANNQESNRNAVDTIVSERALREIYLKGFEIAVKESRPMSIMTSYNLINGIPTADSYDLCTDIARGEWGFDGLIMTDWNGGSSTPLISMHAGNDMIMPGGSARAQNILSGMMDVPPEFDERGQVALKCELMFGSLPVYSTAWNEFVVSAEGTATVSTVLGEGYTAAVAEDGRILVNGEEIYLACPQGWFQPGKFHTPATTEVVTISEDGKTLTYKGNYADNNSICLGDVQKSAINNLNIIMNSNMMQRRYGVEVLNYSTALGELDTYQTVTKSDIAVTAPVDNGLYKLISLMEELDASEYTAESWAAVEEALAAAKAVAANPEAAQAEKDAAVTALVAAFGNLEYGVQKLHLATAVEAAEAILALSKNYEDTEALAAAVEAGKAVLADADAAQETVNDAAYAILDELAKLAKKADISSLESLIEAAKDLLDGNYTSDSLENLKEAIEAAEAVVADQNRGENDIADAYTELINAIINLEMKGSKAALKAMLAKANAVLANADAYVAATIEGLAEVTAEAKAVYDDDDAVQSEVNAAVKTLTLKVAEARLKGDVDGNGVVNTSDSAVLLAASAELKALDADAAASADVNGNGVADTSDAALILQYAAEKIAAF